MSWSARFVVDLLCRVSHRTRSATNAFFWFCLCVRVGGWVRACVRARARAHSRTYTTQKRKPLNFELNKAMQTTWWMQLETTIRRLWKDTAHNYKYSNSIKQVKHTNRERVEKDQFFFSLRLFVRFSLKRKVTKNHKWKHSHTHTQNGGLCTVVLLPTLFYFNCCYYLPFFHNFSLNGILLCACVCLCRNFNPFHSFLNNKVNRT